MDFSHQIIFFIKIFFVTLYCRRMYVRTLAAYLIFLFVVMNFLYGRLVVESTFNNVYEN